MVSDKLSVVSLNKITNLFLGPGRGRDEVESNFSGMSIILSVAG